MQTILVWMLISVSNANSNSGNVTVVSYFDKLNQCQHVQKNLPLHEYSYSSKCIQAEVYLIK